MNLLTLHERFWWSLFVCWTSFEGSLSDLPTRGIPINLFISFTPLHLFPVLVAIPSITDTTHLFIHPLILSTHPIFPSVSPSICFQSNRLSVWLSVCLSVCLPVCLTACFHTSYCLRSVTRGGGGVGRVRPATPWFYGNPKKLQEERGWGFPRPPNPNFFEDPILDPASFFWIWAEIPLCPVSICKGL